jgi:GT2 family glycosyltransferase
MTKKVGIFIPVYHRDKKVKDSINSLLLTSTQCIEVFVYIGINGASPELLRYLEDIKEEFTEKGIHYEIFISKTNIGKPKIVNLMVECIATEIDNKL